MQLSTRFAIVLALALFPAQALATGAAPELPVWQMVQGLFGGLALFLFGMEQMSSALKAAAGDRMKVLLSRVTTNRVTGALAGAVTTAIIQSSSVTTVLVVGFVTAGLMTLGQSVGVIIGANVGTTMTAQIVAFRIEEAALIMIAAGFAATMLSRRDMVRQTGNIIMGLGLVFFGMGLMSVGMAPLRSYEPFMALMAGMENPLPAILVAAAFTALVQSSSATTGIVIAMASGGLITLEAGIALVYGANIGTCVTALLAAIGKSRVALRTATIHVLFNICGVLLWLPLIAPLAGLVRGLSGDPDGVATAAEMAAQVPRQIANAHTIFNIANMLVFLPFGGLLVQASLRLVPERPEPESHVVRPRYLDPALLATPRLALLAGRQELARMAGIAVDCFEKTIAEMLEGRLYPLKTIAPLLGDLRGLHRAQLAYLAQLGRADLTADESARMGRLVAISHNLSRIAEIIESDLVPAAWKVREEGVSEATEGRGTALAEIVVTALKDLREALESPGSGRDEAVRLLKPVVDRTVAETLDAETHWLAGLKNSATERDIEHMLAEMAVIEAIKRVYSQTRRAARECVGAIDD